MDEGYEIRVNPGYGKARFSRRELADILVSMIVLAVAFMVLYRNQTISVYLECHLGPTAKWAGLFAVCFVLVLFSFLLHEFGHKFTAQRYGLWSEFRMYPAGLFLTLITSMLGFLFAAPGAVMIAGMPDRKANGVVSIAGPTVNIILAAIGIAGCLLTNGTAAVMFFLMFASLNSFLALFNLLPIPPLDGSKIIAWDPKIWAVAIAAAAAELIYLYFGMPDLYFLF